MDRIEERLKEAKDDCLTGSISHIGPCEYVEDVNALLSRIEKLEKVRVAAEEYENAKEVWHIMPETEMTDAKAISYLLVIDTAENNLKVALETVKED